MSKVKKLRVLKRKGTLVSKNDKILYSSGDLVIYQKAKKMKKKGLEGKMKHYGRKGE